MPGLRPGGIFQKEQRIYYSAGKRRWQEGGRPRTAAHGVRGGTAPEGRGSCHPGGVTPFCARRTQAAPQARRTHPEDAGDVSAPFSLRGKEKAAGGKKKTPKGDLRRNKLHIPRPAASGRSRPFRCSSFSRTNRFAGFAREPLLWNPLKTTKKRADAPFLDHSRGLVCAKRISHQQNAMQMRIWIVWRGSRNTLRLFRLPYVKYSTGAHVTKRICVSCAQETRFYGRPKGVRTTESVTKIRKL